MKPLTNINEIPQKGLTIIDFWAEWCVACKRLEPQIEAIASELESIAFFKADCDAQPQLCSDFNIRNLPTIILLKNGVEIERKIGSEQCRNLKQWIESFC